MPSPVPPVVTPTTDAITACTIYRREATTALTAARAKREQAQEVLSQAHRVEDLAQRYFERVSELERKALDGDDVTADLAAIQAEKTK